MGTKEREGVKWWAVGMIAFAVVMFVSYLYWLSTSMTGSSSRSGAADGLAVAATQVSSSYRRDVPVAAGYFVDDALAVATSSDADADVQVLSYGAVESGSGRVESVEPGSERVESVEPGSERVESVELGPERAGPEPTGGQDVGDVVYASYWPDAGDDWCLDYDYASRSCLSGLTSGDDWRLLVNRAAACPVEWFGRVLYLPGLGYWRCLDTGPGARCAAGYCSVYLLRDDYVFGLTRGLLLDDGFREVTSENHHLRQHFVEVW